MIQGTKRKCKKCKTVKAITDFDSYERSYGIAYRVICRECREELLKLPEITCTHCKETKPRKEFVRYDRADLGVASICKKCQKDIVVKSGAWLKRMRDQKGRYATDEKYRENKKQLRKDYAIRNKESVVLSHARIRARKFGWEFNLTLEDIVIPDVCPILGIPFDYHTTKRIGNSISLDRIDNTKGYTKDNVRVISYKANHMKANATLEELQLFAKNIIKYIQNVI